MDSIRQSDYALAGALVRRSVWLMFPQFGWKLRTGNPLIDTFSAFVEAYIGSLFPCIEQWEHVLHKPGKYPFQPAADLWRRGFVPTFDGEVWRLHSGEDAAVVYELGH